MFHLLLRDPPDEEEEEEEMDAVVVEVPSLVRSDTIVSAGVGILFVVCDEFIMTIVIIIVASSMCPLLKSSYALF